MTATTRTDMSLSRKPAAIRSKSSEANLLVTFVLFGHWLEMRARSGTSQAIEKLLTLTPPKATVIRDGIEVEIPTDDVIVGDELIIRPGDKIPVDAVVTEGESAVNESMLTGESVPLKKHIDDDNFWSPYGAFRGTHVGPGSVRGCRYERDRREVQKSGWRYSDAEAGSFGT